MVKKIMHHHITGDIRNINENKSKSNPVPRSVRGFLDKDPGPFHSALANACPGQSSGTSLLF